MNTIKETVINENSICLCFPKRTAPVYVCGRIILIFILLKIGFTFILGIFNPAQWRRECKRYYINKSTAKRRIGGDKSSKRSRKNYKENFQLRFLRPLDILHPPFGWKFSSILRKINANCWRGGGPVIKNAREIFQRGFRKVLTHVHENLPESERHLTENFLRLQ